MRVARTTVTKVPLAGRATLGGSASRDLWIVSRPDDRS
jgi:hypothetical protein